MKVSKLGAAILWGGLAVLAPTALRAQSAADSLPETPSALAARVAEKRSQVESLSSRLELAKTEYNEQLRSLAAQRSDLEAQINRERLRLAQTRQDLERLQEQVRQARNRGEELKPVLARTLAGLRALIQAGLPFQTESRLAEVERLERTLAEGSLAPDGVLARLWNQIETEFRLAAESGIYRQTIEVGGERQLAEVARLGTALLYFRTFDGRSGYAVPAAAGWSYQLARDRQEQLEVSNLFDLLRRNLREGYFELPNPMYQR
jgi:hypothetical protein